MADIISRLKLESGEFDSKIKRASQELTAYSQHCRKMGLEMGYANKDAKEFAKSLGSMQTTATTARGKVSELSDAFVNLKAMYNQMTDAEKRGEFGKNLAASLDQLKQRTQQAKQELADITKELNGTNNIGGGGGLFSGDKLSGMLQVFGGNLMTKGVELATGAITGLINETGEMIRQGVELAKQGEGIRIAFQRLGRGDILDGLREATHGTVTDLELMKAAVKFNDFKLPLDELGTMLAFAQQKAKDTGQSVDYMVDSIVTGLGRKSLMILDNLGLSATEIRERMKETGDMTKAVGDIIRDQMAKAGDYVETAADRAAQANVSLQNKMEELGRKFAPIEEASNQLWTSMKIGILDIIGGPLTTLLNELTNAGRQINTLNRLQGGGKGKPTRTEREIEQFRNSTNQNATYNNIRSGYDIDIISRRAALKRNEQDYKDNLKAAGRDSMAQRGALEQYNTTKARLEREITSLETMKADVTATMKEMMKPVEIKIDTNKSIKGISDLKKQLKKLEEQRKKAVKAGDQEQVENLTKQISQVKTNIGYLDPRANKTGSSSKTAQTELQENQKKINDLTQQFVDINAEASKAGIPLTDEQKRLTAEIQEQIRLLQQRNGELSKYAEQAQGRLLLGAGDFQRDGLSNTPGTLLKAPTTAVYENGVRTEKAVPLGGLQLDDKAMKAVQKNIEKQQKNDEKKEVSLGKEVSNIAGGVSGMFSGLQQLGIELPEGLQGVLNGITGVTQILTSIMTIVTAIEAIAGADVLFPFANGGIVPHAANGYFVGGTHFSGDVTPIMANAGELVLNKAQQFNLASQLQGGGMQGLNLTATIRGEQIRLALNNNGRRTGKGEYVQTNRR